MPGKLQTTVFLTDRFGPRSRAVCVALALGVVGWFVGNAAALLVVGHLSMLGYATRSVSEIGTSVGFNVLGAAGLSLSYLIVRFGGADWSAFRSFLRIRTPNRWDVVAIVGGLIGAFLVVVGFSILMELLDPFGTGGEGETHSGIEEGREHPILLLLGIPIALLLTGPGEELLFRGVIQSRLVESFSTVTGVLLASLVFGIVHLPVYAGEALGPTTISLGTVTLLGLYFGVLYELTDNLVVPAVIHGAFNAVVSLSNYLAV